jgi:hypothetical protein
MIWILYVVLGYALIHALRYAFLGAMAGTRDDWVLMSGSLAMAAVLLLAFAALWGVGTALRVAGVVGGGVCLWLAAANGVALDRHVGPEIWRPRRTGAGAASTASLAAGAVSAADGGEVLVDPQLRDGLGWALRDVDGLRWAAPSGGSDRAAVAWVGPLHDPEFGRIVAELEPAPAQREYSIAYACSARCWGTEPIDRSIRRRRAR